MVARLEKIDSAVAGGFCSDALSQESARWHLFTFPLSGQDASDCDLQQRSTAEVAVCKNDSSVSV
jgi:hypothetical protein